MRCTVKHRNGDREEGGRLRGAFACGRGDHGAVGLRKVGMMGMMGMVGMY